MEQIPLKSVDRVTQRELLSVLNQLRTDPRRPRYTSEGKRRVKRQTDDALTLDVRFFFFIEISINPFLSVIQTQTIFINA